MYLQAFFNNAKGLFDSIAASKYAVSADEMKQSICNRLNQPYGPIVTDLGTIEEMDMETFYVHLLMFDMGL